MRQSAAWQRAALLFFGGGRGGGRRFPVAIGGACGQVRVNPERI